MIIQELTEKEELNNFEEIKKSYITKQEFITMLNSIDFIGVKDLDIDLITGYKYFVNDKGIKTIIPLTKVIRFD